jgi:hypothetical protein
MSDRPDPIRCGFDTAFSGYHSAVAPNNPDAARRARARKADVDRCAEVNLQ